MNRKYFIDICTLFEDHYTGISNVNYFIVKYFFENLNDKTEFFHIENVVDKKNIKKLIEDKKGGDWIRKLDKNGMLYKGKVKKYIKDVYSVGIFSHVKYIRNIFNYEVQIIHDITYILTKEFHHQDTVDYHLNFALKDFESNDLNICNSQATYEDIVLYFGVIHSKCIVNLLGSETHNLLDNSLYKNMINKYKVENFILILGTIEPRKNIDIVFKYIENNPKILEKYKFIFLGKNGWNISFEDKILELSRKGINVTNLKHFNFVSDEVRNVLLIYAKFLIYPSFYEGFGLPVLEAMTVGTPVLTTFSSSLPEVGGELSYYFDPFSIESFTKSFNQITKDIQNNKINKNNLIDYSKNFTWDKFNQRMVDEIEKRI